MSVFSTNFTNLCNANGLSQAGAAVAAGLSKSAPTTWRKRNSDPSPESMLLIADFFGVTVGYLMTEHSPDEEIPLIKSKTKWQDVVEPYEYDKLQQRVENLEEQIGAKKEPTTDESDEPKEDVLPISKITLQEYNREEFLQLQEDMRSVIETLKIATGFQKDFEDDDVLIIQQLHSLPDEKQTVARKIFHEVLNSFSGEGDW